MELKVHIKRRNVKQHLKRITLILAIITIYCNSLYSQIASYKVLASEMSSSSNVRLTIMIYGKSKKTIDSEAQCAAIRAVLFDGCSNTAYSKSLMEDAEVTTSEKYPQYMESIYNGRYLDFIASYSATSAFKKGDNNKGTEYIIEVKALNLRKDLEKNGIKKRLGL